MKLKFKLVYATKRNTVPYKLQDKRIDFNDITFVHEGQLSYIINGRNQRTGNVLSGRRNEVQTERH